MSAPKIFTPEYYRRMRELEGSGWWNAAMRDVAALLIRRAELPDRGVFLDVGCGSGQTMEWLMDLLPGWRGVGLDVAAEGLAAGADAGVRNLAQASALNLPYRADSVDLVITLDVLQHLPLDGGDLQALGEMRRVLRTGGVLFVRTNAQAFPVTPDDPEHNFHRYVTSELRQKLERTGFRPERLSRLNALLGLAEIPRELRAEREAESSYHGIMAEPGDTEGIGYRLKRSWLGLEGRAVAAGFTLPLGRTIVALCRAV